MRWFWIDRFVEFVRAEKATSVKNVTLAEEPLDDYLLGRPHYPHSLIIEGMAQTGGLLVGESQEFKKRVVLAKVGKATFDRPVYPSEQLRLTAEIQDLQSTGAVIKGRTWVDGIPHAELEIWFAFLDERFGEGPQFPPADLLRTLRVLKLYDVAVDAAGNRVYPPAYMTEAEQAEAKMAMAKTSRTLP